MTNKIVPPKGTVAVPYMRTGTGTLLVGWLDPKGISIADHDKACHLQCHAGLVVTSGRNSVVIDSDVFHSCGSFVLVIVPTSTGESDHRLAVTAEKSPEVVAKPTCTFVGFRKF